MRVGPVAVEARHPAAQLRGAEAFVAFSSERHREFPLLVRGAGAGGAGGSSALFSSSSTSGAGGVSAASATIAFGGGGSVGASCTDRDGDMSAAAAAARRDASSCFGTTTIGIPAEALPSRSTAATT